MFGVDFPSETRKGQYALRERQSVAYYPLYDEETDTVLCSDDVAREIFLIGLLIRCECCDDRSEARDASLPRQCSQSLFSGNHHGVLLDTQEPDFSEGAGIQRAAIHGGNVSVFCQWIAY